MALIRKTLAERFRERRQRRAFADRAWAVRIARARDLRDGCATWREVDEQLVDFIKAPLSRRVRAWLARTSVRLTASEHLMLGVVVSLVERFRGVYMSSADWAKRLGCSERTVRNLTRKLTEIDLIRKVPQYDDVQPYAGRQTQRGGGSAGRVYTRRQRPNAITLGAVGRELFGRVALSKKMRGVLCEEVSEAVETLCVPDASLTRQPLPPNQGRSCVQDQLLAHARAVNNPDPATRIDALPLAALENAARARARTHLRSIQCPS